MLMDANLTNLKRCVRNNESAPSFDLDQFDCGTFGCLLGNDMIAAGKRNALQDIWPPIAAMKEYAIPICISEWFFHNHDPRRGKFGIIGRNTDLGFEAESGDHRPRFDRSAALNRLRKTIAYIERKRAIWYEADGRVSDLARKREGNWNVCASVMQSIAVSA